MFAFSDFGLPGLSTIPNTDLRLRPERQGIGGSGANPIHPDLLVAMEAGHGDEDAVVSAHGFDRIVPLEKTIPASRGDSLTTVPAGPGMPREFRMRPAG